ncbi:PRC-barrel domain-containing protein [Cumulibacter manganitolerans]|uniref:PRC-barrel domain-containing protein n=1 Tax=Cumulibacter manganitolerans TaxID=1884992 RepID=UPI001885DD44|nr:PRC-barrel domain-containing protein [Cumulibacter manganitolerans]
MTDENAIESLFEATVYDPDGNKIGGVSQVYTDDQTMEPTWVSVNTGLFGTKETLIPLDDARISGEEIHVPYTKDFIKDVPHVDADNHLDADDERRLTEHYHAERYGVPDTEAAGPAVTAEPVAGPVEPSAPGGPAVTADSPRPTDLSGPTAPTQAAGEPRE